MEGLIKCSVLAPRKLRFPVLPCNDLHSKLMFYLCRACAKNQSQRKCTHNDIERSFEGTWVADELRKAIQKRYKILELQEIWEYEVTQYDPKTKSGGLFTDYINNFIKIKTESSGWPKWCITEDQKEAYINEFEEKEGIQLRRDRIAKNPGLRSLSKIMCNSFWGKFGQLENKSMTAVISQPRELFRMLTDPDVVVEAVLPINDKYLAASYSTKVEAQKPLNHVNTVIAAYTTAGARLELYKYLEALGDRIL